MSANISNEKPPTIITKKTSIAERLEYKILSDEDVNLNKKKAYDFLELETFEGERPVREAHVQFLYDEFKSGRFLWHNVSIASAKLGDKVFRINGQHTCWMRVCIPDAEDPKDATVRHLEYKVQSGGQLRALYSAYDRGAPRTVGHLGKVLLIGTTVVEGVWPTAIPKLLAGYRMWTDEKSWRFSAGNASIAEVTSRVSKLHPDLFNMVGNFYRLNFDFGPRVIQRAAVIGAMFATFDKNVKGSIEFWEAVIKGLGFSGTRDPRYVLKNWLDEHGHSYYGKGSKPVSAETSFRTCLLCWNHWRQGNEMHKINPPKTDEDRPKVRA